MNACCFDCRFFELDGAHDGRELTPADWKDGTCEGECHINPPVAGTWITQGDDGFREYAHFPRVFGVDWCGKFKPAQRVGNARETSRPLSLLAILKDDPDQDLPGQEAP